MNDTKYPAQINMNDLTPLEEAQRWLKNGGQFQADPAARIIDRLVNELALKNPAADGGNERLESLQRWARDMESGISLGLVTPDITFAKRCIEGILALPTPLKAAAGEWQELADRMAVVLKNYVGVVAYAYDPEDWGKMKDEGKPARDILQEWQRMSKTPTPPQPQTKE